MKKRIRFLSVPVLGLLLTMLGGCFDMPDESVMPVWDVDLNIPVIDKTMALSELLETNKNITTTGSDSLYLLMINDINKSVVVQGDLTIPFHWAPEDTLPIAGLGNQTLKGHIIYNPDKNYHLDTASFKSGVFNLNLKNNSPGSVTFKFVLPGFRNKTTGKMIEEVKVLNAGSSDKIVISLENALYAELPLNSSGTDLSTYKYQKEEGFLFVAEVTSASPYVYVQCKTEVNSSEIVLDHIAGRLKTTVLPHSEQSFETELGDDVENFAENIDFKAVDLKLNLKTKGDMRNLKINNKLKVTGYKKSSSGNLYSPVKLLFNGSEYKESDIIAGQDNWFEFNNSNSNVSKFMLNLPAVIKVESDVVLYANSAMQDETQAISNTDSVKAIMNINSPVEIAVKNAEFSDTLEVDLTEDQKDDISKGNEAVLGVEIENHIGLGAIARATFVDANYRPLFSLKSKVNSSEVDYIDVQPSYVDANGLPSTPAVTTSNIVLSGDQIKAFDNAKYVIVKVQLRSSGYTGGTAFGPYVSVRAKDYMRYRIFGRLNYHVNTDEED